MTHSLRRLTKSSIAFVIVGVVFLVPFAFVVLNAFKSGADAASLTLAWPEEVTGWENLQEVLTARDGMIWTALVNSTIVTVLSVTLMVILAALFAYVAERRRDRWSANSNYLILGALMVPPAVVPTVWVLQNLGLYDTLIGLVAVEVAYGMAFCVLLFRAGVAAIPQELDEAARMDGSSPLRTFFTVILPLLRPTVVTAIVVQSASVFNDFVNPLYVTPGAENATLQLTLYNFHSAFVVDWGPLFMNILIITIPPLIVFLFFNRQIISGMTGGAVKG